MGDIKLHGLIALGSFGALYQGICGGTKVAIKQLRSKWLDNAHAQQDFRNEILVLSKCSHPNIVMFMGCVDDAVENVPKLVVLEWVEGGNLYDAIHKEKGEARRLLPSERLHFMNDIARGMEYLHSNNPCIIHRDLKPHNLLLSELGGSEGAGVGAGVRAGGGGGSLLRAGGSGGSLGGEGGAGAGGEGGFCCTNGQPRRVVKIADFGLSRLHSAEKEVATMTGNTGSLRWMAPEVISYKKYNEKIDMYSFGMVVWEMFSYDVPYSSLNVVQVALAVTRGKRLRIPDACSPEVKSLITRCWDEDHNVRPSFEDIAKECKEIRDAQLGAPVRSLWTSSASPAPVSSNSMDSPVQTQGVVLQGKDTSDDEQQQQEKQQHGVVDEPPPKNGCGCVVSCFHFTT
jgi:serine/threonine protein kinase